MKKKYVKFWIAASMSLSVSANAWVVSTSATVDQVWIWQDDAPVYFQTSTGAVCYVPSTEKNAYSLILGLWASGKKATIHCWDSEENTQGVKGHRFHKIAAEKL